MPTPLLFASHTESNAELKTCKHTGHALKCGGECRASVHNFAHPALGLSLTQEQQLHRVAAAHPLADKGSSKYEGDVCAVALHEQLQIAVLPLVSSVHCLTMRKQ